MKKKLNPGKIARIRERREAGETLESLARIFKCSIGTVSNALAAPAGPVKKSPARAKPPRAASEPSSEALPTPDDLRRSLADQVRALRADVESAETPAQRATANRLLVSAQQLLARMTPPDISVAPPGMMLVEASEMKKLAAQGEERLFQLINGTFRSEMEALEKLPACPTCGARSAFAKGSQS